jgi:hypothetical protein
VKTCHFHFLLHQLTFTFENEFRNIVLKRKRKLNKKLSVHHVELQVRVMATITLPERQ